MNNLMKKAAEALNPGDVITKFTCGGCGDGQLLVLEKNGGWFEFSIRHAKLKIIRDPGGPYRWNGQAFLDKEGQVYDHIGPDSEVIKGAGFVELGWYKSLPKEARFQIEPANLLGPMDVSIVRKLEAVVARESNDSAEQLGNMQLAIQFAFGNTELTEEQTRLMVAVMNAHAEKYMRSQPFGGLGIIMIERDGTQVRAG